MSNWLSNHKHKDIPQLTTSLVKLFNFVMELEKKVGIGAVYDGGMKRVCLGLVILKRWNVSYDSRPIGDEKWNSTRLTRNSIVY